MPVLMASVINEKGATLWRLFRLLFLKSKYESLLYIQNGAYNG